MYNLSCQYIGYQQYRPDADKVRKNHTRLGRYFTYLTKGQSTVWGLDLLNQKDKRLFLTEGIFKACRFHNYGLNALAVIGNNPKHLKEWFKLLSYHYEIICICDEDDAGRALAKFGDRYISKTVDELSEGEFLDFLTEHKF